MLCFHYARVCLYLCVLAMGYSALELDVPVPISFGRNYIVMILLGNESK